MKNQTIRLRTISIRWLWVLAAILGMQGMGSAQAQYPEQVLRFADLVLYNGKILTADRDDPNFSIREAVALPPLTRVS